MINNNKRASFIIGAGASLDFCHKLSTQSITNNVLNGTYSDKLKIDKDKTLKFLIIIMDELKKVKESPNFEDVFQYLSDIQTNYDTTLNHIPRFDIPDSMISLGIDDCFIKNTKYYVILTVYESIRDKRYLGNSIKDSWKKNIFLTVANENYLLDLFILNYDEYLDNIVDDYNDGFLESGNDPAIGKYWVFNEKHSHEYIKTNLLNHLHGSIKYSIYRPPMEPIEKPMYKYAAPNYSPLGKDYANQDKTMSTYFPIVTGMDKLNSLMHPPFRCYHANFEISLSSNDRLIIIGYGFGDYYINSTIISFIKTNGKKTIIISPSKPPEWCEIPDYEKNKLISNEKENIYWYKGTFKEASESSVLIKFLKNNFI